MRGDYYFKKRKSALTFSTILCYNIKIGFRFSILRKGCDAAAYVLHYQSKAVSASARPPSGQLKTLQGGIPSFP